MSFYFVFQLPVARAILESMVEKGGGTAHELAKRLDTKYAPTTVRSALSSLASAGFVGKMPMPHVRGHKGKQPSVYLLMPQGVKAAEPGMLEQMARQEIMEPR